MTKVLYGCGSILSMNKGTTNQHLRRHPNCREIARWSFNPPKVAVDFMNAEIDAVVSEEGC